MNTAQDPYLSAMKYSLNLLGKREYSAKMLQDKLVKRQYEEALIAKIIIEMKKMLT